ncbi:MAG TPA: ATP-binding protein, partial [Minicystis sp.]|nr:ATP-binding protein [Minicystis sp.]
MPGMSGETLVRELRARSELDAVPIVVVTAKADEALRVALLEHGASDYLVKPFPLAELRARVANLVSRKLADERVRRSEALLDGILSLSADAIVTCDEALSIVRFTRGASAIFGYEAPEVLGRPLEVLIPERFRAVHAEHVRAFLEGAATARLMNDGRPSVVGLRKDGEEFPIEASISKLGLDGRTVLTIAARDVTERERAREALERAVLARDEVLGVVAHDLRNPLNAIVLHATLLQRARPRDRRDPAPVDAIRRAAARMNRMIQDLLDVARLEAGQSLAIERRPIAPASVVNAALESQRAAAAAASIEIAADVAPSGDVFADEHRLLQVFENLVGNALKFTPAGGRVTVGAAVTGGEVVFSVTDTGEGLSPEHAARLFDRFWQATQDRRGAGLGLSVAQAIVEGHGGRIWVESRAGQGTRVSFTIPLAASSAVAV